MKTNAVLIGALAFAGCAHPHQHAAGEHGATDPGAMTHGANHRFENPDEWAPRFEDPARDEWQKPAEVIAALALQPADRVADIGSATGYFPVRLARALPSGKVFGIDIEPKMTLYLKERAAREGLPNLTAVLGTPDDPLIPEKVELVLIVDTYHHLQDRPAYFERLKRQLAADGRLAIIDFKRDSPIGPPPEHRISPEQVRAELKKAGWQQLAEHDFLPHQYFLVFAPVSQGP